MGFNPSRPRRKSSFDYVYVAAAVLVALGLVLWALLG
jgi:hypothetical protein